MPRKKETRGGAHNVKYKTKKQALKAAETQRNEWRKENTRCINVRFNIENDNDILSMLDSVPNKADYIRQLIRQDIASKKEEN
ncbi:MAG: hypothetical protein J6J11_07375 [Treponema sp.]|nr:hypothetical protein [Treponema sp.]